VYQISWPGIKAYKTAPKEQRMGFIRQQEERLALRLLTWQYRRMNITLPDQTELETGASKLVEDAHRIARERGRNVMTIMKELVQDLKKK
jgi:hypothetical protein